MQSAKKLGDLPNYSIYMLNRKMGLAGVPYGGAEQQIITQPKYDLIYPFVKEHAIVQIGDCYGLIDKYGVETIPVIYKFISPNWEKGYFYVSDNHGGDEHFLDCNNKPYILNSPIDVIKKIIISKEHITEKNFYVSQTKNPNIVTYEKNDLTHVYNLQIDRVILICKGVRLVNGNKLIYKDRYSYKIGIIDINGKQLVYPKYDGLFYSATNEDYVPENLLEAKIGEKSGYIDFDGNIRVPFIYRFCGTFENGYAWVSNESGKTGVIDKYGNIVEPLVHDNVLQLNDGRVVFVDKGFNERYFVMGKPKDYVKQNYSHKSFRFDIFHNPEYVGVETSQRKRGVTSLDGRVLIPAIYDDITFWQTMYKGVIVKKDNKYGIIDINNNTLLSFEYDSLGVVETTKNGGKEIFYIAEKNGKYGLLNGSYRECIPLIYNRLKYHKTYNSFVVEVNRESAMIDFNNDILIPFTSNHISTW